MRKALETKFEAAIGVSNAASMPRVNPLGLLLEPAADTFLVVGNIGSHLDLTSEREIHQVEKKLT